MELKRQVIYLDNNSTTKIDPRVLERMMPYLTDEYANASSTHVFGTGANDAVKTARSQVAGILNADPHEITFTGGATEAINIAIKGVAESFEQRGKHIITVSTEHKAVLDTCQYLEAKGFEVTYLPVQPDGLIDLEELRARLRTDTILVSVMLVNNETGVIQPIKEIAELVHGAGALLMSDCTQAVGKIPIDVKEMGIDILCFSGHKMHAPKGIGGLYVRQHSSRIKLPALFHGGGHERGTRSGTLNVPGIVALGAACQLAQKEMKTNAKTIEDLRNYLEVEILKMEGAVINGHKEKRLYNTTNILIRGVDSDAVIMGLSNPESDSPLIAISNGSACTSASIDPSHVLIAMGLNETEAFCSLRFSLSKFTTKEEIDIVLKSLKVVVGSLRSMVA